MGVLNCELSPLAFAELYRLLADGKPNQSLSERLERLGYDHDWLTLVSEAYDAKWCSEATWMTPELIETSVLGAEHSVVASWLLAGLRHTGHSHDFSSELRTAISERAVSDLADVPASLPSALSPTVIGWTLGKIVGSVDGSLPVIPAFPLEDPHIYSAYVGLVEHVASLPGNLDQLPEMAGSATYVRGAGLAEALAGGEDGPRKAINKLMLESTSLAPENVLVRMRRNWADGFVDRRNVLTHIRADVGKVTFTEAADQTKTWQQIEQTVAGITQFVCQAISARLYEHMPPAVHGDPWEKFMKRDLEVWD